MSVVDILLFHELAHRLHLFQQFINDIRGDTGFEDTASHQTECGDELLTVVGIVQQVQEEVHDILVVAGAWCTVVLEPCEIGERIVLAVAPAALEGIVEVEADKAVATVVPAAIGLHVVVGPVIIIEEEGDSHIVGELVDVEQRL